MKQPPEIRQLPDLVANQIAAGEVIERPAAVVKELVENSLDAGATRVTVRIEDGGRRLVEVVDDGHGMRPDQLRLALARHATSKIASAEDLFRVATLGFRGEALPSIAAVSEFEIASRTAGSDGGHRVAWAGAEERGSGPCAMAQGTRISVRNLFWNVPARLKFLKSEASETGHIAEQVTRFALSHPHAAFRLEVDGRTDLDLPPQEELAGRVRALFGPEIAGDLCAVVSGTPGLEVTGFAAHPRHAKPTSKRQYVFLNGRFVRDRLLLAAVRDGFKGFLEPRLHGTVFLHLDVDPAAVDVNVHPTKHEVRFRREGEVFALLSKALQAALAEHQGGFRLLTAEDRAKVQAERQAQPASPIVGRTVVKPAAPAPLPLVVVQERFIARETPVTPPASASAPSLVPSPAPLRVAAPATTYQPPRTPDPGPRTPDLPASVRRVTQVNDMYLLIETEQGIRLVDQHALHEKALWQALDATVGDLAHSGVQQLAVPIVVQLSAVELAAIVPLLPELARHGIDAERFGPSSIAIRSHPAVLARCNWARFLAELASDGGQAVAQLSERIRHSAACHAAVKAGQRLDPSQQRELAAMLFSLEGLEHCPHGRPTTLDLTWPELAKRFQR
ncbi:MAG: DNA mismatch repair endonuclease MutL [Planctomycetes bacterium]|nr:DNA mismatch repair endonuclease MutL [Planctomycetota bacterium]